MAVGLVLGAVVGLLCGATVAAAALSKKAAGQAARLVVAERAQAELERANTAVASAQREVAALREDRVALIEQLRTAERDAAASTERWEAELARLHESFAASSQTALERLFRQFGEVTGRHNEERDRTMQATLNPVTDLLQRFEQHITTVEKERKEDQGSLVEQVDQLRRTQEQLSKETRLLVTALRTPHTRGSWGELQLRRVVEMAGMSEHCDFTEQGSVRNDDGQLQRPDLVVHLPGDAVVVVDAKVPLAGYLDAMDATDEEGRQRGLKALASQVRNHVTQLASKSYWRQFDRAPDFVACFVPGDAVLAAAFEADPTLTESALEQHVLLTGPTNLIALLQAAAFGWRQQRLAAHTEEIQQLAAQLYERLSNFAGHLDKLRGSLDRAVGSYNDAIGSLERRLLPTARRLHGLGVGAMVGELDAPQLLARLPVAGGAAELRPVDDLPIDEDP